MVWEICPPLVVDQQPSVPVRCTSMTAYLSPACLCVAGGPAGRPPVRRRRRRSPQNAMTTTIRPCKGSSAAGLPIWPGPGPGGVRGSWQEEAAGQTGEEARRKGKESNDPTVSRRRQPILTRPCPATGWPPWRCPGQDLGAPCPPPQDSAYTILPSTLLSGRGGRRGRTGSLTRCIITKWSRCDPTDNVLVALRRPLRSFLWVRLIPSSIEAHIELASRMAGAAGHDPRPSLRPEHEPIGTAACIRAEELAEKGE